MKHLFTLIFCFTLVYTYGQKINNFKAEQKNGELIFSYDLNGSTDNIFNIDAYYSLDSKTWNKIEKAYGDVGDSIQSGTNKSFVVWIDHLNNIEKQVSFKITAEYYTVDQKKMGNVKDNDGYMYNWIRFGKNKWITQNLRATKDDAECGGLFTNSEARNACPDGWSLPSDEDWMELEIAFGVDKEKAKAHGLKEIDLKKLHNSGFAIEECNYNASLYPNQKALAFWTSSENKMLYTGYSDKYFARIIRLDEGKISKELRKKTEELSVRCIQNATYLANVESVIQVNLNLSPTVGEVNHPFTGEKLQWIYTANNIWLKKDINGIYFYKELEKKCPAGWKIPEQKDWKDLFAEVTPSVKLENKDQIISDRFSNKGLWSLNFSSNDYWMDIPYYTYNTYWISDADKEISKKRIAFPSNKKGEAKWIDRQTNEKAKVRCVLDNKDYIKTKDNIKTGKFNDARDQQEYGFVEIDNSIWMSQNLNFDAGENSMCRNNIRTDCDLFGKMYNIQVIGNGCPDGWRIPSQEEWKHILIKKAANNLKILYPFGGTGFNLLLGGNLIYDEENKRDVYSAKYLFVKDGKPGYYYIDSNGKVEVEEKAKKRDFYYVRCIKK